MTPEKISQFEIRETLGAGGMGVVYKAYDTKLNRFVAIKALAGNIAHNPEFRKRFLIEAQAAAALNHPNIATIYETCEENNDAYIVMEFIEGEELSKKTSHGKIELIEALDYAIQIAEGLKAAHQSGIVHRDIKSQNIMIGNSNLVKIMDFGLAKLAGHSMMTQLGTTIGTINYMSPEQSRGEEVDQRTDLWAFGVVLYEMLSGQLPFKGAYEQAVIYSILNEDPKPISEFVKDLTVELDSVLKKLLAKIPDNRYQTAGEVLSDLKIIKKSLETGIPVEALKSQDSVAEYIAQSKVTGMRESFSAKPRKYYKSITLILFILLAAAAIFYKGKDIAAFFGIKSAKHIAVLPFEVIGGDSKDLSFASGLFETITSKLSQLEQFDGKLWVVPSSEIRKAKISDPVQAVNHFGVNLIFNGSIQKTDNGYRITINLIDGNTKEQLASRLIDDQLSSNSVIQDEVVIKIADMLNVELKPEMKNVLSNGGTKNAEAYDLYLTGQGKLAISSNANDLIESKMDFEKAVEKDSSFTLAYVGLANACYKMFDQTNDKTWIDKAVQYCNKARSGKGRLLESDIMLGKIYNTQGKYAEAEAIFNSVLELDPNNYDANRSKAASLKALGKSKDAETIYKNIISIKPDYWIGYLSLGYFYYQEGKYKEALDQYQKVIELIPNNAMGYRSAASMYVFLNDIPKAIELYNKALQIEPDFRTYSNLAAIYFKEGKYKDAVRLFEKVVEINSTDYKVWGYLASSYYWTPDEKDKSIDATKKAIQLAELQLKVNSKDELVLSQLASYYGMLKDKPKTEYYLNELRKFELKNVETMFSIGTTYEYWLNDRDNALNWIEKALKKGYPVKEVYEAPGLKSLINDKIFTDFLKSLKPDNKF